MGSSITRTRPAGLNSPSSCQEITRLGRHHGSPSGCSLLYEDHFSTTLEEFYATINIPYYGRLDSPGFRDYEAFYHSLCVGEDRDLSWAKLTSIQFPSVHYFALFISRCLLAKTDCTNTCAPDLYVLCFALC